MASASLHDWRGRRSGELDEVELAHAKVGGKDRGRRYATQQINRAYAVLLASHFQGFCRDLHTESADCILRTFPPPPGLEIPVRNGFVRNRQLDKGNANPANIGADFERMGMDMWPALRASSAAASQWNSRLTELNEWRNAIVHQDFTPPQFAAGAVLLLSKVNRWRKACNHLAVAMDATMQGYLSKIVGGPPW